MMVLLRFVQTLLLILVIALGTERPDSANERGDLQPSAQKEAFPSGTETPIQPGANGESEEKSSGETHDGDGEGAEDGKLVGFDTTNVAVPYKSVAFVGCLNEELPLHGRETIRELFRPPRA